MSKINLAEIQIQKDITWWKVHFTELTPEEKQYQSGVYDTLSKVCVFVEDETLFGK